MQRGKSAGGVPCSDFLLWRVMQRMALFQNYGAKRGKNASIRLCSIVVFRIVPQTKLLRFLAAI
jgi:hypothetical protein